MSVIKSNKKEIIIFLLILLIEILIFLPWIKGHYATDTYKIIDIGYKEAAHGSLIDGRLFMYLSGSIADKLNLPVLGYVRITLILALVMSTLSVMLIRKVIIERVPENNILDICVTSLLGYSMIFNFMHIENLYFVEAFVMSASVFLNILASKILVDGKKGYYIKALLLLTISLFMYQGTIGMFLAMYIFLILTKESDDYKKTLKKIIIDAVGVLAIALLNVLSVKIINTYLNNVHSRTTNINIIRNIKIIFYNMKTVLENSCGLFPRYLFLFFVAMISFIFIINKNFLKNKSVYINYIFILLVTTISAFATNVLIMSCFYAGRIKFSLGALIGLLLTYTYVQIKKYKDDAFKWLLIAVLVSYVIIGIINYINLVNDHKLVNQLEIKQVKEIGRKIEDYEEENSKQIKYIALIRCIGSQYFTETKCNAVVTANAVRCEWASIGAINFYLNKDYEQKFISNKEYIEIVNENDLHDSINFVDDTMYIEVYDY